MRYANSNGILFRAYSFDSLNCGRNKLHVSSLFFSKKVLNSSHKAICSVSLNVFPVIRNVAYVLLQSLAGYM